MAKLIKFALVGIVILVIGCVVVALLAPPTPSKPVVPVVISPIAPTPEPAATQQPKQISSTDTPIAPQKSAVEISGKVIKCTPSVIYEKKQDKTLVGIEVTLRNKSPDEISINPLYFELVDSDGFVYRAELASCDGQVDTTKLASNNAIRGIVGFELPPNVKPKSIKYKGGLIGGPEAIADLQP